MDKLLSWIKDFFRIAVKWGLVREPRPTALRAPSSCLWSRDPQQRHAYRNRVDIELHLRPTHGKAQRCGVKDPPKDAVHNLDPELHIPHPETAEAKHPTETVGNEAWDTRVALLDEVAENIVTEVKNLQLRLSKMAASEAELLRRLQETEESLQSKEMRLTEVNTRLITAKRELVKQEEMWHERFRFSQMWLWEKERAWERESATMVAKIEQLEKELGQKSKKSSLWMKMRRRMSAPKKNGPRLINDIRI